MVVYVDTVVALRIAKLVCGGVGVSCVDLLCCHNSGIAPLGHGTCARAGCQLAPCCQLGVLQLSDAELSLMA
jgi:hypothetical protein